MAMRRPVHGQLKGVHRSRRVGSGMVFTDFRPYSAGDDIRHIDWGIYLRMDRLILKLFEEEADLPIYLLVDASRSMDYGTPSKLDYARKLAAALCYVGLLNHDRVNLVSFADGAVEALPARRGKSQAPQAFRFLESIQPGRTNRVAARAAALLWIAAHARPGGGDLRLSRPGRDRAGIRGAAPIPPRCGRGPRDQRRGTRAAASRRGRARRCGGWQRQRARCYAALARGLPQSIPATRARG